MKQREQQQQQQQQPPPPQQRSIPDPLSASVEMAINHPPPKRAKIYPQDRGETRNHPPPLPATIQLLPHPLHISPCPPVLIFAKQENEEVFHPLHLVPPSLVGLAVAVSFQYHTISIYKLIQLFDQIQNKYKLEAKNIRHIFKRCRKGYVISVENIVI